jgi:hippurate hydrolase
MAEARLKAIAEATCMAFGATAQVAYHHGYPNMVNHERETDFARDVARAVSGACDEAPLVMGGEDFAYMLEARPGAYILLGNGDTAEVHNAEYDFNDEAIPAGCSWYAGIAEARLPLTQ